MEHDHFIEIELLCTNYHIEPGFLDSLYEYGLIEIKRIEESRYLEKEKIRDLERMIHLHHDLEINMEGLDTISHLLDRLNQLQAEMNQLRNRLRFYENL